MTDQATMTPEQIQQLFAAMTPEQLQLMKPFLQLFGITANDTPQQMFEKIFNPDQALQMTVLPTKADVTHLKCLGAVDLLTRDAFYRKDENGKEELITGTPSLARYLYETTILGMKSYKGTNLAIFKDIFLNNPPNEMTITQAPLPSAIPAAPKRSLSDRLLRRTQD